MGGTRFAAPFPDNIFSENVRVEKQSKNKKYPPRDSANSGNSIKRFLGFAGVARFWDNIENWFFHQNHRENAKTLFLAFPKSPLPDRFKIFGGEGGNCWPVLHSHVQMPKNAQNRNVSLQPLEVAKSVNFVNFGICWLHFGKTEWNLQLACACVAPRQPACSLRAACVACVAPR